ncbi:FAD-dependent thymidylate synthase [bacterium]|nr:FAD-dependent thymidylate synthase [bacterium]
MNQTVLPVAITSSLVNAYQDGTGKKMSAQDIIGYCARISNPDNQHSAENGKLLKYLIDNKHWSPFEMVDMVLEINTTRDIARQILRHRSFSFQEFSQRYADPTKDLAVYMREARLQDTKNRQNSVETDDVGLQAWWDAQQKFLTTHSQRIYREALDKGIAKEQARAVLPEGNMQSRMYMKGNVRSWIHYCELRAGNGTQKEHREIAVKCADILKNHLPFLKPWYKELTGA